MYQRRCDAMSGPALRSNFPMCTTMVMKKRRASFARLSVQFRCHVCDVLTNELEGSWASRLPTAGRWPQASWRRRARPFGSAAILTFFSLDVPEQCCGLCAPALTRAGSAAWLSLYTPGRRPTFQPPEFPRKPRKPRKPAVWLSGWQRTAKWVAESAETPSDADAANVPATPSTALSG